ncbi:MAG: divalent-cation tolerance protein CutA [Rhodospirillales bacterium]|jgi:periplasmic divalent cation tolerance protein|nr:divalent-cation tolerance protein CutA [Rhodospirillales bacterium]
MSTVMIYVTAGSRAEAAMIGRTIVEERLAACANVVPEIASFYWWEGTVQEDSEASLILKTRRELTENVISRVKELHNYDCPCVVSFPIADGNKEFLNWVIKETS